MKHLPAFRDQEVSCCSLSTLQYMMYSDYSGRHLKQIFSSYSAKRWGKSNNFGAGVKLTKVGVENTSKSSNDEVLV